MMNKHIARMTEIARVGIWNMVREYLGLPTIDRFRPDSLHLVDLCNRSPRVNQQQVSASSNHSLPGQSSHAQMNTNEPIDHSKPTAVTDPRYSNNMDNADDYIDFNIGDSVNDDIVETDNESDNQMSNQITQNSNNPPSQSSDITEIPPCLLGFQLPQPILSNSKSIELAVNGLVGCVMALDNDGYPSLPVPSLPGMTAWPFKVINQDKGKKALEFFRQSDFYPVRNYDDNLTEADISLDSHKIMLHGRNCGSDLCKSYLESSIVSRTFTRSTWW